MFVDGGPKPLPSSFFIPASLTMEVFWIYSQISSNGRSSLLLGIGLPIQLALSWVLCTQLLSAGALLEWERNTVTRRRRKDEYNSTFPLLCKWIPYVGGTNLTDGHGRRKRRSRDEAYIEPLSGCISQTREWQYCQ